VTRFLSRIEVFVEGDIVRAKLYDGDNVQEVACCRRVAIGAAMSVLDQTDPTASADVLPMLMKRAAGA